MATATDALGEITTPTYDADAKTIETMFSNDGEIDAFGDADIRS